MGLLGQHTWKFAVPQGFGVHHALNPNPYRGVFGNDGPAYARDVQDLIQAATPGAWPSVCGAGAAGRAGVASCRVPAGWQLQRAGSGVGASPGEPVAGTAGPCPWPCPALLPLLA
jgi:alanine-glyoxylate transaminase/(R)-3-amino-2-methylpropionate-pyruvate transaminase